MGLIDIADMRINIFTLHSSQRKRNFQHVFRYQEDRESIHLDEFGAGYLEDIPAAKHKFYLKAIRQAQPIS